MNELLYCIQYTNRQNFTHNFKIFEEGKQCLILYNNAQPVFQLLFCFAFCLANQDFGNHEYHLIDQQK